MADASLRFVKFNRGTPRAFNKLTTKDENTIYFISETDATTGKLYLGSKLISGGTSINLTDIGDINIDENGLTVNSVLAYDPETSTWVSRNITDMTGASAEEDGVSGLVPAPEAGDQDKFLSGDGTWKAVSGSLTEEQINQISSISTLQATVSTLVGSNSNMSAYRIALQAFLDNGDSSVSLNERLTKLENIINDTTDDEGNAVSGLQSITSNLVIEVNEIDERLQWQNLAE